METILRWVARWLAAILNKYGDPQLQAKLDKYKADAAALSQKVKEAQEAAVESALEYDNSVKSRTEWEKLLRESRAKEDALEQQLRSSQDRVNQITNEASNLKKAIDSRSDADVLRDRL